MSLSLQTVDAADFEPMLTLRMAAMRPSLERVGRYNPEVGRARFQAAFAPACMHHIVSDGQRIGFITLRPEVVGGTPVAGALRLDHLYLLPGHQGQGVGAWAMAWVKQQAQAADCTVWVTALRDSEANRFYQAQGFVLQSEEPFDLHYRWADDSAQSGPVAPCQPQAPTA